MSNIFNLISETIAAIFDPSGNAMDQATRRRRLREQRRLRAELRAERRARERYERIEQAKEVSRVTERLLRGIELEDVIAARNEQFRHRLSSGAENVPGHIRDMLALRSDWVMVGSDIRDAMSTSPDITPERKREIERMIANKAHREICEKRQLTNAT